VTIYLHVAPSPGRHSKDILQWWRDHRLNFPDLSDLARNVSCMMATNVANERVFITGGHVVNNGRSNLRSLPINATGTLFQQCSEEGLKLD